MPGLSKRIFPLLIFYLAGCISDQPAPQIPEIKPIYFSKNWKADIGFSTYDGCYIFRDGKDGLTALANLGNGLWSSESGNNGRTWTSPAKIFSHKNPFVPVISNQDLIATISIKTVPNGGQMYFHAKLDTGWSEAAPIRDTNWGEFGIGRLAGDNSGNYYFPFSDWREGNPDIYCAASSDRGKSWGTNIRINDDHSGQEQEFASILIAPNGDLYALWQDNRNPKTLFDIYFSASFDSGQTWNTNIRVNDDTTHTWQGAPSAVLGTDGVIYVVWYDYRDTGTHGDVSSRIYFSSSRDGGNTWSKNIPVSKASDQDCWWPYITATSNGKLFCSWHSPKDFPSANVFLSCSEDQGRTWSEPQFVNDDHFYKYHHSGERIHPDSLGNIFLSWLDWREGKPAVYMAKAINQPDKNRMERGERPVKNREEPKPRLSFTEDSIMFVDTFMGGARSQWRERSGIWIIKDSTYIGYGNARSSIDVEPVGNFSFSGHFLLDPLEHYSARIYFQIKSKNTKEEVYYRLSNIFRKGVVLEYYNGESLVFVDESPFPMQKNTWYSFQAVVKGRTLNYFLNDSLVMANKSLRYIRNGRLGIGAGHPPAYFRNIRITSIK